MQAAIRFRVELLNSICRFSFLLACTLVANSQSIAYAQDEFIIVSSGSFKMGSPTSETHRIPDETLHTVSLSKAYYLGRTEVSWILWNRVRDWALFHGYTELSKGNNGFKGLDNEDHPVVAVTWWDAIQWCNARSEMEGKSPVYYRSKIYESKSVVRSGLSIVYYNQEANGYRLPTEAEWEYARRSAASDSTTTAKHTLNNGYAGWFSENSKTNTHPCGTMESNPWGFHDMPGNAWEWCWDWYSEYNDVTVVDPIGPSTGAARIMRGGSWTNPVNYGRPAYRHALAPSTVFYTIGFRIARNF